MLKQKVCIAETQTCGFGVFVEEFRAFILSSVAASQRSTLFFLIIRCFWTKGKGTYNEKVNKSSLSSAISPQTRLMKRNLERCD